MKHIKRYEKHFFHDDNGRSADCVQRRTSAPILGTIPPPKEETYGS